MNKAILSILIVGILGIILTMIVPINYVNIPLLFVLTFSLLLFIITKEKKILIELFDVRKELRMIKEGKLTKRDEKFITIGILIGMIFTLLYKLFF